MKVAVVTGGGHGLGRLISKGLGERGFRVVVTDIDVASAQAVADEIGNGAQAAKLDVANSADHGRIAELAKDLGTTALWVNNAGILRAGYVWDQSDDDLRMQSEINFLGLMYGCRQAVRLMREAGGHILNIASMSSFVPAPGIAAYGATKYAALGFSLSLQGELDEVGIDIKVSALCPDVFDTDLVRNVKDKQEASLLFARPALSAESVAAQALKLVEKPKLVVAYPKTWGTLARLTQPLPGAALYALGQLRKRSTR